jgi:RNA polymerase sigma-70 factor (ECF subfamily)
LVRAEPSRPARLEEGGRGIGDVQLVEAAQEGELWAKDALFRRYGLDVTRMVARVLGSTQDVEDIAHETFIRAFERLDGLKEPAAFKTWLFRIAITRTRNVIRRRKLERTLGLQAGDDDATLERLADDTVSAEERMDLAFIDEMLKRVPAKQRIAWVLRAVEGRSVKEVSEICSCSEATVKRRVRAVQRLISARVTVRGGRHG